MKTRLVLILCLVLVTTIGVAVWHRGREAERVRLERSSANSQAMRDQSSWNMERRSLENQRSMARISMDAAADRYKRQPTERNEEKRDAAVEAYLAIDAKLTAHERERIPAPGRVEK